MIKQAQIKQELQSFMHSQDLVIANHDTYDISNCCQAQFQLASPLPVELSLALS